MVRQSFTASAGNDRVLLSTGTGWSVLTQETFTSELVSSGYRQGEIASNHAFVTVSARPSTILRLEGYVRRSETNRRIDRFLTNIRLNAFTVSTYGAEADVWPGGGRFSVTPGWTRRSVDRDIEFDNISRERSLYRAESSSDEIFVRTKWKLSPRFSLRATPSILWADKTAFVTEPERAGRLNLALSYASTGGTSSATGFYTLRTRRNDSMSFTGADGVAVTQDSRGSLQQIGASGAVAPTETTSMYWSYAWSRDEYSNNLLSATTRRFDPTPVFYSRDDRQTFLLGSHSVTLGADVTPAGRMQYGVSYTTTRTAGDTASGRVLSVLPAEDGRIENWYHTAALRMECDLGRSLKLGFSYLLDYYTDDIYSDLTGGLNTVIVGVGYRF
jgi:hypothetical protein